jgi:hypothetical protein
MAVEALAAVALALAVLWLVLQPLLRPGPSAARGYEPLDPEETPKGMALAALKEIEFDRETGKLSDADYELLKTRYTAEAVAALRDERGPVSDDIEALISARVLSLRSASAVTPPDTPPGIAADDSGPAPVCDACGPCPEPDALYCSRCGRRLATRPRCDGCGADLSPGSRYCDRCGRQVAA